MEKKFLKDILSNKNKSKEIINNKEKIKIDIVNILQNLLHKNLDIKLINLETNSKKHFSMLNITSINTKYLSNLTLELNKEIKTNIYKSKRYKFSQSIKKLNISNINNKFNLKNYSTFSPIRAKTNFNLYKSEKKSNKLNQRFQTESSKIFNKINKSRSRNKHLINSTYLRSPISLQKSIFNSGIKSKLNTFINTTKKKAINNSNKKGNLYHSRNHYSIDSSISNMTNESNYNKKNNNNNLKSFKFKGSNIDQLSNKKINTNQKFGLIGRLKRSIDKLDYKHSQNKKLSLIKSKKENKLIRSSKKSSNKNNIKHKKSNNIKNKKNIINKDKIINLESENLINKDPLLINAMKDLEFIPKELVAINISRDELNMFINKSKDTSFKIKNDKLNESKEIIDNKIVLKNEIKLDNKLLEEYFPNIFIFLSKNDFINLKNCSKAFHSFIINYLLKSLNIDKNIILEKLNKINLNENELPKNLDIKDIKLSKGTFKAIKLLNDEVFSRIFFEEKIPDKDILFVYKIYFQLINDKEILNNNLTNQNFWEKSRTYFQKYKEKISDLLINNIEQEKLIINKENLYKIYKLIDKNNEKLRPEYFSKLCGTTSLFIFYIKDILDYLGFTNEKKFINNSYWSLLEITNYIDNKIKGLDSFINKF